MPAQLPLQFVFNSDKSFNHFFPGNNQEAVDHLLACIEGTGERLIYIWGTSGLGKSHLLQASCQHSRKRDKTSFYLPLTAQTLPNTSILDGIENYGLVCIDNIQHIAANSEWEHAFFVIFNQLQELNHSLILSANSPPNSVPIKLADLKTRLSWGLTLKLQDMSEEQRIQALSFKAHLHGFKLSHQIGQYLLNNYSRDLPSLWALLEKIDHETLAAKQKLTIPFLKKILAKY